MNDRNGSTTIPPRGDLGTVVRLAAAAAVLVSGLVHLQLYLDGYRDFPNENLGRSFLLDVVASVVLAAALVLRRDLIVRIGAALLLVGALVAFAVSRSDNGIFGFTERGFSPSPQSAIAVMAAVVGLVLLLATFVPAIGAGRQLDNRVALGAAGAIVAVALVGAAMWARTDTVSTAADEPTTTAASPATSTSTTAVATTAVATTVAASPAASDKPASSSTAPPTPTTTTPATTTTAAATTTSPAPADAVVTVTISDFAFDPPTLDVPVGTTVRWVNEDSFDHTVVAEDGSFASETLGNGDMFEFTFETAGEIPYVCGIHPSMVGAVNVTA